ncbi:RNA pseudouridine synthase [Mycoplasma sp. 'Moose RK']|uniref:pseudouridine synthase family protein n=1 Tax=Mycoplasma sp. 'Moose RK' TaxID=2780095 RepID=UPI0018C27292|nr:RluA family pseudouridine synthase [Mycoplasma sp. 'Moose RK']MBG0730505.1 RluA family pseudouridine synthase [Mycoplasma sp. 'Moose RK']
MIEFVANENQQGQKLIQLVKKLLLNFSYNEIQKLFRNKKIKVNNSFVAKNYSVCLGDKILVFANAKTKNLVEKITEFSLRLEVIYQDKNILIVNKPANLPVHGDKFNLDLAVWNYLKIKQYALFLPSHVGRLDKKTSGIILYGLNYQSVVELNKKQRFFEKIYTFKSDIELKKPLKTNFFVKKNNEKKKMEITESAIESSVISTTFYAKNKHKFAILHSGKKHQIRVSLAALGFPIFGDKKYGGKKDDQLFLHSFSLKMQELEGFLQYLNGKKFVSKPKWW